MAKIIICKERGEERPHCAKGLCKKCYTRKWREEHLDYDQKWRKENLDPEKRKVYLQNWRKAHPKKVKEYALKQRKIRSKKIRKYNQEWREAHPDYGRKWRKINSKKMKEYEVKWRLLKRYGVSLEEYDLLLESQGNVCAICGMTPEENGKRLAVDHDHETGKIRGLLCNNCNCMLGWAGDDPVILTRATEYILRMKEA